MRKIILYGCLLLVVVLAVVAVSNRITTVETAAKPAQTPTLLRIPALQVNAPVLAVGQTANGTMDAPTSKALHSPYWTSVFWYNQGAVPGQNGNAVIAGHVDRVGGDPAIFWSLSSLAPGDKVFVTMANSQQLQFVVNRVVRYPASAPSQNVINAVFGPASGRHLNLITCSGVWTGNGYDERLVVFTTQIA